MENKRKKQNGNKLSFGFALGCIFVGVSSLVYVLYLKYNLNLPIPFGGHYVPPPFNCGWIILDV